jgi:hypothetical protein
MLPIDSRRPIGLLSARDALEGLLAAVDISWASNIGDPGDLAQQTGPGFLK